MMFEGTENIFWPYVNGADVALMSGETMHKIMMVVSLRTAEGTPVATLPQQRGPGFLLRKKRPRKSQYIAATNLWRQKRPRKSDCIWITHLDKKVIPRESEYISATNLDIRMVVVARKNRFKAAAAVSFYCYCCWISVNVLQSAT